MTAHRSVPGTSTPRAVVLAAALVAAAAVAALWWAPASSDGPPWWQAAALTQGLAWCGAAAAVRRPAPSPGREVDGVWTPVLLLVTGACLVTASVLLSAGLPEPAFVALVWVGAGVALPLAMVAYPSGRPRTRLERAAVVTVLVVGLVGTAGSALPGPGSGAIEVPDLLRLDDVRVLDLFGVLGVVQGTVVVVALWWRGEQGDPDLRATLLWPALGAATAGLLVGHVLFVSESTGVPGLVLAVVALALLLLVPVSVVVGIVAPRSQDVRRLAGGLTVGVVMVDLSIGVVAGILAALTVATGQEPTRGMVAVVATGCAVAFGPVLVRVRRITEEVLFGGSTDPVDAMSRLGAELGADSSPGAWVEALRSSLVVSRVELRSGGRLLAVAGEGTGATASTALRVGGEQIGELVVTLPPESTRLPPRTRAVLDLVAAPLARALQAVRLAEELHASRGRVVQAREEERRRLRRDLHDGLGPVLTGVAYSADAATNLLRSDPDRAVSLLGQLRGDTTDAIDEIRRIVHGLRPPALDEVGLSAALRQRALRYAGSVDVEVRCTLPAADAPGRLPAATEVVAYRVAVEGLTNAVRHARTTDGRRAATVVITLRGAAEGELVVAVQDDGDSPAPWTVGTGLASMAVRCDEVGGSLVTGPSTVGGRVEARLPLGPGLEPRPEPLVPQPRGDATPAGRAGT